MVPARISAPVQKNVSSSSYQLTFTALSTISRPNFTCRDARLAQQFQREVLNWISWFEGQYSRFIPDSLVGRINAAAGSHWVDVDAENEMLFNLCQDMVTFTGGAFDPTVLPLIRLWNWKATPPILPSGHAVGETLELVGWGRIQRRKEGIFLPRLGMCLALGAIGKEYAVDCIVTQALQRGIDNVLVDFGQDLRVHGSPPERASWFVGLEDPKRPGSCWTGVAVNNHAVATSGDYVRHFSADGRRYGHIIDPRNGYPANAGCLSVSVVAPQCTIAGILSTTAFVLGPKEGLDLISTSPGAEGAITTDTDCFQTSGFSRLTVK